MFGGGYARHMYELAHNAQKHNAKVIEANNSLLVDLNKAAALNEALCRRFAVFHANLKVCQYDITFGDNPPEIILRFQALLIESMQNEAATAQTLTDILNWAAWGHSSPVVQAFLEHGKISLIPLNPETKSAHIFHHYYHVGATANFLGQINRPELTQALLEKYAENKPNFYKDLLLIRPEIVANETNFTREKLDTNILGIGGEDLLYFSFATKVASAKCMKPEQEQFLLNGIAQDWRDMHTDAVSLSNVEQTVRDFDNFCTAMGNVVNDPVIAAIIRMQKTVLSCFKANSLGWYPDYYRGGWDALNQVISALASGESDYFETAKDIAKNPVKHVKWGSFGGWVRSPSAKNQFTNDLTTIYENLDHEKHQAYAGFFEFMHERNKEINAQHKFVVKMKVKGKTKAEAELDDQSPSAIHHTNIFAQVDSMIGRLNKHIGELEKQSPLRALYEMQVRVLQRLQKGKGNIQVGKKWQDSQYSAEWKEQVAIIVACAENDTAIVNAHADEKVQRTSSVFGRTKTQSYVNDRKPKLADITTEMLTGEHNLLLEIRELNTALNQTHPTIAAWANGGAVGSTVLHASRRHESDDEDNDSDNGQGVGGSPKAATKERDEMVSVKF